MYNVKGLFDHDQRKSNKEEKMQKKFAKKFAKERTNLFCIFIYFFLDQNMVFKGQSDRRQSDLGTK
jgi:hypothetical protein